MVSRSRVQVVVQVGVVALLALVAAAGAGATTGPGQAVQVPVTLTAAKIAIPSDQFTIASQPNVARYPRGAEIAFKIVNRGNRPAVLRLRLLSKLNLSGAGAPKKVVSTRPIARGARTTMQLSFFFRARFELQEVVGGRIVARHPLVVF